MSLSKGIWVRGNGSRILRNFVCDVLAWGSRCEAQPFETRNRPLICYDEILDLLPFEVCLRGFDGMPT